MALNTITEVRLLSVPLESDYIHTLHFDTEAEQIAYFKGKTKKSEHDFSYQRKDQTIRYPLHIDELWQCNYVMYRNAFYNNKWFYAFIKKMEYVNDGVTMIHIETDVIQTWYFDYTVKTCFVEREHSADDRIGFNTIPEGLELGEYVSNVHNKDDSLKENHKFVVASTVAVDGHDELGEGGTTMEIVGGMYGGIYSGFRYYTYNVYPNVGGCQMSNILQTIVDEKGMDAISSVFMAPEFLCTNSAGAVISNDFIPLSSGHKYYDHIETKPFDTYGLDGYQPRNNKLFTYPYCYLHVDNGNGGNAIYPYEYFEDDDMTFHVEGVLCPGCSIRMVPRWYKGMSYADKEGLNLGKFPICNWSSDIYTNWVTQNGVNVATSIASGASSLIGGAISGAMFGGVGGAVGGAIAGGLSGASQIANTLNEVHKADMIPPQTQGNINCGDVVTSANCNTFHYYHMSIKREFARLIDCYFDMYGYKVSRWKVPNKNHRSIYWYTKTIECNIDGNIPQEDLQKIKNCYDKGITFWREPDKIGNYSIASQNTITAVG